MKRIPIVLLLIGVAATGLIYFMPSAEGIIVEECETGEECEWVSVNCCPENAGAQWECINAGESVIECPEDPICPQVVSPRPEEECSCADGICQVTD